MSDQFDELLLQIIDETLRSTFGPTATEMIYVYLKTKSCPTSEIPQKLNVFCLGLRNILEIHTFTRAGIHKDITTLGITTIGITAILEKTITKSLCLKLGVEFNEVGPIDFPDYIEKIKTVFYHNESVSKTHNV